MPENGRRNEPQRGNKLLSPNLSKKWFRDVAGGSSRSIWRIWIRDKHSEGVTADAGGCERG